jgi:ATP adenylyltransferase
MMTGAGPHLGAPDRGPVSALQGDCPFCQRLAARHDLIADTSLCAAFYDTTPLNPGHVLVVPRRHEPDFLALGSEERSEILRMAVELRALLHERYRPDGFNLGVNVGEAAGQTVGHAHLHLIPRYAGDVPDPRGGIRWLIPERAAYWETKP